MVVSFFYTVRLIENEDFLVLIDCYDVTKMIKNQFHIFDAKMDMKQLCHQKVQIQLFQMKVPSFHDSKLSNWGHPTYHILFLD